MEATKIPPAFPILESVCVRVFDRYNRLQILREVPLGVTSVYEGKGGQCRDRIKAIENQTFWADNSDPTPEPTRRTAVRSRIHYWGIIEIAADAERVHFDDRIQLGQWQLWHSDLTCTQKVLSRRCAMRIATRIFIKSASDHAEE